VCVAVSIIFDVFRLRLFFRRGCWLLASIGLTMIPGCGVKSGPVPPQTVYPAAIGDLHASADPAGINLTWSRPMHYVSGHSLRDLGNFVILRSEGNRSFEPLVEIPVTDQERFVPQRTYSYLDGETQMGNSYRYEILSRTTDGYTSAPSNQVRFTRIQPHNNPQKLTLPTPTPLPPGSP
jgi:hypothetical protein